VTPPETVPTAVVDLVRWRPEWAPSLASAVEASLAELAPYMPWATPTYGLADARTYIDGSIADWDAGTNWNYAIVTRAGEVVGSTGLMTRLGPGVLEIGYWLHTGHAGRGYATTVAQALATVGLAQPGIETVVIRHDAANVASGRVAEKAGFIRIGSVDVADGSGVEVRWERRGAARVPMIATDVVIEHPPTNPADGEEVVEVAVLPVAEAVAFLAPEDLIHADVLRLAAEMGLA